MSAKLFVGSLPFSTTDEELKEVFSKIGEVVNANIVMDKMTGRSRGFGFVEMADEKSAKDAISKLNSSDVGGRKIFVSEAHPPKNAPQDGNSTSSKDENIPEVKVETTDDEKAEPEEEEKTEAIQEESNVAVADEPAKDEDNTEQK